MHCHKPPQLTATCPHHNTCTPPWQDSILRSSRFFSPSYARPVPPPASEALLVSQAGHPARSGATRQGSLLTAGLVRDKRPFVHLYMYELLCCKGLIHAQDQAFPPALSKGRHHPGISPGQQEGASPLVKPSPPGYNQYWWITIIFTQLLLRVHIYLEKKLEYFPPFIIPK